MLRIVLINILLFLLPFLIYGAYMVWVKGVAPGKLVNTAPILWLLIFGFALLFVFVGTLIQFQSGDRDGTYHPSVLEDGVIKPGRID